MKGLMIIHTCGKFHQDSICESKVKKFQILLQDQKSEFQAAFGWFFFQSIMSNTILCIVVRILRKRAKKPVFWLFFRGFLATPSYALWVAPQFLFQRKGLMVIHHRGTFHEDSFCGSKVIDFQIVSWQCSSHEMGPF